MAGAMLTGDCGNRGSCGSGPHGAAPPGGYTYLGLLFAVALAGVGLATLGQDAATAAQRERERELRFRGGEIRQAIEHYARATPVGAPRWPHRLGDLLRDTRGPLPRHHLRRLYADPFTGQPDWVLLPAPGDASALAGVRSRAQVQALSVASAATVPAGQSTGPSTDSSAHATPASPACVCDWVFSALSDTPASPLPPDIAGVAPAPAQAPLIQTKPAQ